MKKNEMNVIETPWHKLSKEDQNKWNDAAKKSGILNGQGNYNLCQDQLKRKFVQKSSF